MDGRTNSSSADLLDLRLLTVFVSFRPARACALVGRSAGVTADGLVVDLVVILVASPVVIAASIALPGRFHLGEAGPLRHGVTIPSRHPAAHLPYGLCTGASINRSGECRVCGADGALLIQAVRSGAVDKADSLVVRRSKDRSCPAARGSWVSRMQVFRSGVLWFAIAVPARQSGGRRLVGGLPLVAPWRPSGFVVPIQGQRAAWLWSLAGQSAGRPTLVTRVRLRVRLASRSARTVELDELRLRAQVGTPCSCRVSASGPRRCRSSPHDCGDAVAGVVDRCPSEKHCAGPPFSSGMTWYCTNREWTSTKECT